MMKKRLLAFSLCALMVLLLLAPAAYAGDAGNVTGQMTLENCDAENGKFSCDVKLSGAPIAGRVFAVLHAESGQVKDVKRYDVAQERVAVNLPSVASTDSVHFLWLDANNMPVAAPEIHLMSENGKLDYDDLAAKLLMLREKSEQIKQQRPENILASDNENPKDRLIIASDKALNWKEFEGLDENNVIEMPNHLYVLQFVNPLDALNCKEKLEENHQKYPSVRYVEFDSVEKVENIPISQEDEVELQSGAWRSWGVERSGFDKYLAELQKKGLQNQEIVVAVVDSGVDKEHSCLQGRLLTGRDFVSNDPLNYRDGVGHGTHVAGIIAECTSGMNVKILPVRFVNEHGYWSPLILSAGIRYAADNGAHVINLSLGCSEHSQTIDDAVQYALSKGVAVVAAACNSDQDAKEFCPAHMEKCITVAAMELKGDTLTRWGRSNYGSVVDIASAGGGVMSCIPGNGKNQNRHRTDSGTSMAAPHVAAAAALLKCEHPGYTYSQISDALKNAAEPLTTPKNKPLGAGFLDMRPFIEQNVTVTFNANGGAGTMLPQTVTVGKPAALSANAFIWNGFQFVNWNTKADGSGTSYEDKAQFTAQSDTTLYAQWKEWPIIETGPHALLYADGTLDFRNSDAPAPGKEVVKSYKVPLTDVLQYSPWYDDRADVKRVTFSEAMRPYSTASWFARFENLTEVSGLDRLDTSQTTDMSQMFARCKSLTTLDLSGLDTSAVTKMKAMFSGCESLTELNLTGWNTANVTDMSDMFNNCKKLVKVYASDDFAPGQGVMTPFDFGAPINTDTTVYAGWRQGGGNGLVIGSGTVDVSDTDALIPITIEKRGNTGAAALQFDVVFPDELILTAKPEVGTLFADAGLHRDTFTSPYRITLGDDTSTTDTTAEGVLVTLYFKVRPGAAAGTYNITIQGQDNYNAAVDPVTFPVTNGYIDVRADGSGLVVGTGTAIAGDDDAIIPITIEKKGYIGASALQFDVAFPDALMLTAKPEVGTLFADTGLHRDTFTSPYRISLGDDNAKTNVTAEGVLVTLYFKVRPGAAAGTYDITIQNQDNYSANVDSVTFPVTPGRITVSSGASLMAADSGGSLVVGSGTVNAGDTETVIPIAIDKMGFAGAAALQFDVIFPDALILTAKPEVGPLFADKGLHQDIFTSPYRISLGDDNAREDVTAEGNLVTLYFKVKPGTAPGTYAIRVQGQDNYNADVNQVTYGVTSGAITVLPNGETVVVTFDGNGGTPATTQVIVGKGEKVAQPVVNPTRSGYYFNGWFTSGAGRVSNSVGMFNNCTAIVGQQGTTYDPARTDITYARIDGGTSRPGYFSKK